MDERAEGQDQGAPERRGTALGDVWAASWGLRLGLALVALLVWIGAATVPSTSSPAANTSVSPPVSAPAAKAVSPTAASPSAVPPDTVAGLPQQSLDITYDYGSGPQPVPGQGSTSEP